MQFDHYPSLVQTSVQAGDTISNTGSPTAFATKYVIQPNSFIPGQVIYIKSGGVFSTPVVANRQMALDIMVGGSSVTGTGARTPAAAGLSNSPWVMEATLICTLDGPNGTIEGNCLWTFYNNATDFGQAWPGATNTPFVFDTTIVNDVELLVQYTVGDADNLITMRHLNVLVGV